MSRRTLELLGLKKELKIEANLEKSEFNGRLQQKVKPDRLFFLDHFDDNRKEFYGMVSEEKFYLRRSNKLLAKSPFARAYGEINSFGTKTELVIQIIGWNWFVLLWFLSLSAIFGLILYNSIKTGTMGLIVVFGPIISISYLFLIIKLRNGVTRFENFLNSELEKI